MTLLPAADLHVHSRFSSRPTEWFLQRVGAPESFTDPLVVYRRCRERGMTLVTLTDHDTIDGALEIAHLPGTFVSCEVTVRFPEDGCSIHCLVYGIDEAQHREIQRLRGNVYELRDYLYDNDIAHSVAHPLFRVDERLQLEHFEKLLALFKGFEGLNGAHDARASAVTRAVLNNLTPRQLEEIVNRHDIDPRDSEPWRKHLTAGSDDHSGLYVASSWSAAPEGAGADHCRFLAALRQGDLTLEGAAGSSLKLGRSLHSIAARYARSRPAKQDCALHLLGWISDGIVNGRMQATPELEPTGELPGVSSRRRFAPGVEYAVRSELLARDTDTGTLEGTSYRLATRIGQRLAFEAIGRSAAALRAGDVGEALGSLESLIPAALAVAPYLVSLHQLHKDEPLVRAVGERFPAARLLRERSGRTIWFRDSLERPGAMDDGLAAAAVRIAGSADRVEVVRLAGAAAEGSPFPSRVFAPLGELRHLGAGDRSLPLPPLFDLLEHCERERFDRVLITTPGPMGAAARCVGACLNLESAAIFEPLAFDLLLGGVGQLLPETALSTYLRWLYARADRVTVLDDVSRAILEGLGFVAERLRVADAASDEPAREAGPHTFSVAM